MMDTEKIDDDGLLPIFAHDHPEAQVMRWSNTELRAIKEYARRCIAAKAVQANDIKAQRDELLAALKIMTPLVRLKYGNLDKDVFAEVEKSEAIIAKCEAQS